MRNTAQLQPCRVIAQSFQPMNTEVTTARGIYFTGLGLWAQSLCWVPPGAPAVHPGEKVSRSVWAAGAACLLLPQKEQVLPRWVLRARAEPQHLADHSSPRDTRPKRGDGGGADLGPREQETWFPQWWLNFRPYHPITSEALAKVSPEV